MSAQYPLDLPHRTAYAAADYLPAACNAAARALVEGWREWPNRAAAIWGAAGAGKTHLATVWSSATDARFIDPDGFDALDLGAAPAPFRFVLDLGPRDLSLEWEQPLFHLLNMTRERRGALLIVARQAPARWAPALPDLGSRLRALPAAEVAGPDDELFTAVLAKQFADRQLLVDQQTLDFLATRSERSFAAAGDLVERLDRAALARRRKINSRLAGEVLAEIEAERSPED